MLNLFVCAVLAGSPQAPVSWTAPPNPDADGILNEAHRDTRAGRHDVALAKFLWFHHHALEHEPGLSGVRRSFALAYWFELAQAYPPALEALTRTRDEALEELRKRQDDDVFEPFSDVQSINHTLGQESLTVRIFVELDEARPAAARQVFHVAGPALVRAREYRLCGKYVDPERDWLVAAQIYQVGRRYEERSGPEHHPFAAKSFTNRVATLLALLVVNGRRQEAEAIAQKARLEWDDPAFRAAIDSALRGKVPDPWP